ncbi:MAG: DUF2235 domain-containing protein [Roseovarius sp.]
MPRKPEMPRKIVMLLDGTANALTPNTTNLPRLYRILKQSKTQLVFYDPGVGTFEEGSSYLQSWRRFKEGLGMATGWGMERNVKQAYRYLCTATGTTDEIKDEIFLMGFSRGAYAARVLGGLIHQIGLLRPDQLHLVDYAFDAYRKIADDRPEAADSSAPFEAVDIFTDHLKPRRVPIRCVAVFDTVASMLTIEGARLRMRPYANTDNNKSVQSVRQALAIDERRVMFKPCLWGDKRIYRGGKFGRDTSQDVNEVWFSGVHADIGGGYPEAEAGLAKLPLRWMLNELEPMGLEIDTRAYRKYALGAYNDAYIAPNPLAAPHDSMTPDWKILEALPFKHTRYTQTHRKVRFGFYRPKCERRIISDGANIHASVFERRGTESDYDQPNIPATHTVVDDLGSSKDP